MSDNVSKEIKEAKELYKFEEDGELVIIKKKNVKLAEAIYQIIYRKYEENSNDFEKEKPNDKWTAMMCFKKMKSMKSDCTDEEEYIELYRELLKKACIAVNRENSTRLTSNEIERIVKYISEKCKTPKDFEEYLRKEDYALVNDIRKLKNKEEKIRDNYSFATKLCHYACYHMFDNNRDRYPIFDSIIETHLEEYYKKYVSDNEYKKIRSTICDGNNDYVNYINNIDKIIRKIEGENISKNGFDHLLWIYHSGKRV